MIAETLGPALRAIDQGLTGQSCAREESFSDLFPLLGDQEAQSDVRRRAPDSRHCGLLAARPDACLSCGLKDNPHPGDKASLALALARNREAVEFALDLYSEHEMGLMSRADMLALDPGQAYAVRFIRAFERSRTERALSLFAESIMVRKATQ